MLAAIPAIPAGGRFGGDAPQGGCSCGLAALPEPCPRGAAAAACEEGRGLCTRKNFLPEGSAGQDWMRLNFGGSSEEEDQGGNQRGWEKAVEKLGKG